MDTHPAENMDEDLSLGLDLQMLPSNQSLEFPSVKSPPQGPPISSNLLNVIGELKEKPSHTSSFDSSVTCVSESYFPDTSPSSKNSALNQPDAASDVQCNTLTGPGDPLLPVMLPQYQTSATSIPMPLLDSIQLGTDRMFKLRNYQVEISQNVEKYNNDIIILPTGTGKTAVAINVIYKYLNASEDPRLKILFLTPRVVLTEQQLEVIKSHLPVKMADKTRKLTGGDVESMDDLERILTGSEWSVIVATPQTVLNYFLAFSSSTMQSFALIIFDECHNANGRNPYNRLLFQYMDEKFANNGSRINLPQLIGLTASVGLGESKDEYEAMLHIVSLCSRMDVQQRPADVIEYKEELESIRNPPTEVQRRVVEGVIRADPLSRCIKDEIMTEIIADITNKIKAHRALQRIIFKPNSDRTSRSFVQACRNAENDLSYLHDTYQNDVARDCVISLKHLRIYHEALRWADLARLSDALTYLTTELSSPEVSGNKFACRYRDVWKPRLEVLAANEHQYPNDKLSILKEELDIAFSPEYCETVDLARALVFVEYRRAAFQIRDWINSLGCRFKAERFVSSLVSVSEFGMKSEESKAVMAKFRNGEINVLVTTSVLSEGIDIPECNCSIRYMFMKDVVAEVQVPGRVRASKGRVVAIANEKQFMMYQDNKKKEKDMAKGLERMRALPEGRFMQMLKDEQDSDYRARRPIRKKLAGIETGFRKISEAPILCRQCGGRIGELSDVHRYLENSFLVLDGNILNNVDLKEGSEYGSAPRDGMADVGILVCKSIKCNAELGKVITIKISREIKKLGVWTLEKVRIHGSDQNWSKWDDVLKKYTVADIKQEKLRAKVLAGCCIPVDVE